MKPAVDPFGAVADPSRRKILQMLAAESLPVNAVAAHFKMSRPAVSRHLRVLSAAGLISVTASGRERYCSLRAEGFAELQQWLEYFESFWSEKLHGLDRLLAEERAQTPVKKGKKR
jgi:DNA-binding transcriptional ArsR family regulator